MAAKQMRTAFALLVLSQMAAGCTESTVTAPTRPSVVTPPAPPPLPVPGPSVLADATLSGMVYEIVDGSPAHRRGIEGVSVYCEPCGESTHNFAYTDADGEYVFPRGVWTEGRDSFPTRIRVQKTGYQDPPGLPTPTRPNPSGPGWREVLVAGDTRFEIELVPR